MSTKDEIAGRAECAGGWPSHDACGECELCLGAMMRAALPKGDLVVPMPRVAPPRPAGIPWVPIADMPEAWKDGRRILAWGGTGRLARPFTMAWLYRSDGTEEPQWYTDGFAPSAPVTHVADINPPERV